MVNFKNFADETLRVGPFTVIIGANASGKSNIRDAFRFLHGIGRGYYAGGDFRREVRARVGKGSGRPIRGAPKEIMSALASDLPRVFSEFSIQVEC